MADKYTHTLNVAIGLDITSLLSPANIPGVKKYLHVDRDADLVSAIAQDKYSKLERAIREAGFDIVDAEFSKIPVDNRNSIDVKQDDKTEISAPEEESSDETDAKEDINAVIVDEIKRAIKDVADFDGEISAININGERVVDVQNSDELHKMTDLPKEVPINFEELDAGELMVISYLDKDQNLKFRVIDDNEKMEDK